MRPVHGRSRRMLPTLLACAFALAPGVPRGAEIEVLPLGDPSRALELVTGEPRQYLDLAGPAGDGGSRARSLEDMARALSEADVVVLGEQHAHQSGHEMQRQILEALQALRPIAFGMEFFESEDDPALARYVAGETDAERMLEETGWYSSGSFHHAYYLPLVDACRAKRAPVFGLNVPRVVIRKISREGVESLSAEEKALVGELGAPEPRHRFVVDLMMGGVGASLGPAFDGMLRGQMAWDSAMAQSILRARRGIAKDRLIVVLAGMGHSAHGLGIPARLRELDPALKVVVVNPIVAEKPDDDAQVHPGMEASATATTSRGYADWAYVLPDEQGAQALPVFGMKLEAAEAGLSVASVEAGSPADLAGIRKGDVLAAIAGAKAPATPAAARFALSSARWGDRVELGVRRDGADVVVPVLLVPPTDGPGRWLRSRAASELLDTFDPKAARSILPSPVNGLPQARLVELGRKAVRLDVSSGSRLVQAWLLDEAGRPARGLLAEPAADGAVIVELERGASGEVTGEKRFGRDGKLVEPPATPAPAP